VQHFEQIVVTPICLWVKVTAAQLNEKNEDSASRRHCHQSFTAHNHFVNVDEGWEL
jgi:hypothetical protein